VGGIDAAVVDELRGEDLLPEETGPAGALRGPAAEDVVDAVDADRGVRRPGALARNLIDEGTVVVGGAVGVAPRRLDGESPGVLVRRVDADGNILVEEAHVAGRVARHPKRG